MHNNYTTNHKIFIMRNVCEVKLDEYSYADNGTPNVQQYIF